MAEAVTEKVVDLAEAAKHGQSARPAPESSVWQTGRAFAFATYMLVASQLFAAPAPFTQTKHQVEHQRDVQKWKSFVAKWQELGLQAWVDTQESDEPKMDDEAQKALSEAGNSTGFPYPAYTKALIAILTRRVEAGTMKAADAESALQRAHQHGLEWSRKNGFHKVN